MDFFATAKMQVDSSRVFDGFGTLDGGLNAGWDPSLIAKNQYALGLNVSNRGGLVSTRSGLRQRLLNFDGDATQAAFNSGLFQGICAYTGSDKSQNCIIVALSGRLFRIRLANNYEVDDISPSIAEVITSDVAIPAAIGDSMTIPVISELPFSVNQSIQIGPASLLITAIAPDQLTATWNGGSNSSTVMTSQTVGLPPNYDEMTAATVASGGTGYTDNDILTIAGGTLASGGIAASVQVAVSAGVITGIKNIQTTGQYVIGSGPSTPNSPTGGTGTGASLNLTITTLTSANVPVNWPSAVSVGDNITISGFALKVTAVGSTYLVCTYTTVSTVYLQSQVQVLKSGTPYTFTEPLYSGTTVQDQNGNVIFADMGDYQESDMINMWQGQNYLFGTAIAKSTIIFDGSTTTIAQQSLQQLPSGFMGTYSWGRNWLCNVDKQSYIASDLTGDPSGSPGLAYKDAILYVTENDYLAGGGSFSIPSDFGSITAMTTLPQLDNSLGIGPVLIGCDNGVFSNQAPTDRTTWQNLTYPIQSVALSGSGPVGPRNNVVCNSDWWFRSRDGIRQFLAARRDFQYGLGTTPQSKEVGPFLDSDDPNLLKYGSAMQFDNRLYFTVNPQNTTANGVIHNGLVSINLDTVSSMSGKEPPVWESILTGFKIFGCVSINDGGVMRGFVLVLSSDGTKIDLWELVPGALSDVSKGGTTGNLIPSNATYSSPGTGTFFYGAGNLISRLKTYRFVWGVNDTIVHIPNGGGGYDSYNNPGAGKDIVFTVAIAANTNQFLIYGSAYYPVTASLYEQDAAYNYQPIVATLDTRRMDFGDGAQLKKLISAELYLDEISDNVSISVYFRPDEYPTWTLWETIPKCANIKQCGLITSGSCTIIWTPSEQQYAARIMLPRPPETNNQITNQPIDRFHAMQFRFVITGHCRISQFKAHAKTQQQKMEGEPVPSSATCSTISSCGENLFTYNAYGI